MIRPPEGIVRGLGIVAFWLLVVGVYVIPYTAPAHRWLYPADFPAATAALLVLFVWRWRTSAPGRLGLPRRAGAVIASLVVLAVLYAGSRWLVAGIAADAGLMLAPHGMAAHVRWLFQALNEEMLLGFLPLVALHRRFGRPVAVAVGLAAVFALLHVAMYGLGGEHRWIRPQTAAALLAVGVLRNGLILAAGHVGFAWALHAAWNMAMFAGWWQQGPAGRELREPEVFDRFLGDPTMLVITIAAAVGALLLLGKKGVALSVTKPPPSALTG